MEDAGNIEMEPIGPDRENPKVPEADSDVMNDSSDPNICFMLGHKYLTGDGVKKDSKKAVSLFERAIQNGNYEAAEYLGILYYQGNRLRTNLKKSYDYFRTAAESGLPFSQYWVGMFLEQGEVVEKDPESAAKYFEAAAEQNFQPAVSHLGEFYLNQPYLPFCLSFCGIYSLSQFYFFFYQNQINYS